MAEQKTVSKMTMAQLQTEINVPKDKKNDFGGFKYRSAEDILSAVKQIINPHGWTIICTDRVTEIAGHAYMEGIATIYNEKHEEIETASSFARVELIKKGMDAAQICGSASSYARKYALNGLLALSDGIDPDSLDNTDQHKLSAKPVEIKAEEPKEIDDVVFQRALNLLKDPKGSMTKDYIIKKFKLSKEQREILDKS